MADRELKQFIEEISRTLYEEQKILGIFLNVGFTEMEIQREIHNVKNEDYKYEKAAKRLLLTHFMKFSKREGMDILKEVFLV